MKLYVRMDPQANEAGYRYDEAYPSEIAAALGIDYEAAANRWTAEFPCHCGPEYTERGLVAPHCEHHYAEDGSRIIVNAALGLDDE